MTFGVGGGGVCVHVSEGADMGGTEDDGRALG